MSTTLPRQDPTNREQKSNLDETTQLEGVVRGQVLNALGHPGGLHSIQVRRVWGDNYRVNVFIGQEFASCRVANSFFVKADGHGNILECIPPITRAYERQLHD